MTRPTLRWVATCARGLEEILRNELRAEGFDVYEMPSPTPAGPRGPAGGVVPEEKTEDSVRKRKKDESSSLRSGAPAAESVARSERSATSPRPRAEIGGVAFSGSLEAGVRANWRLRTANRVLLELASWPAPDDHALYLGACHLLDLQSRDPSRSRPASPPRSTPAATDSSSLFPLTESFSFSSSSEPKDTAAAAAVSFACPLSQLQELLSPDRTFAIAATSSRSRIRDTRWVGLKVKDGLVDAQRQRFGRRASVARDEPDVALRVRLFEDRATLLLDTSGEPLDHRGYRVETTLAPLREQLAAAAILASGWDGRGPVVDPMCGSGTFLAEAGAISAGLAPNRLRARWAFERLPYFDPALLARVRSEPFRAADPGSPLVGTDLDAATIEAARANLRAAGLETRARLIVGDGFELEPPAGPGLVAVNPPYGDRIAAAPAQWRRLGDLLKQRYRGWRAVVIAGDPELGKQIGLRPARRLPFWNGPLEARILVFELY